MTGLAALLLLRRGRIGRLGGTVLRHLMQRLRQRLPRDTPILVGLWPAEDVTLGALRVKAQIGADYFTSSPGDAVSACADAAAAA